MRRLLTGIAGAVGLAALLRALRRRRATPSQPQPPAPDPAAELREKLAQAREAAADETDFEAAGMGAETIVADDDAAADVDARRRSVHEQGRATADEMRRSADDEAGEA